MCYSRIYKTKSPFSLNRDIYRRRLSLQKNSHNKIIFMPFILYAVFQPSLTTRNVEARFDRRLFM